MNLIISNNKKIFDKYSNKNKIKLGNNFYIMAENLKANLLIHKNLFLFGNILGYYDKDNKFKKSSLKRLPKKYFNYKSFVKHSIEGYFVFIKNSNKKIQIKTDSRGIIDLFYNLDKKTLTISNNYYQICNLVHKKTLNNFAILNSLSTVAKRPPLRDSFFNEIKRLDFDQEIIIDRNKFKIIERKVNLPEYKEVSDETSATENYDQNFQEYIEIGNRKKKFLFMSSGWDSSFVLTKLIKKYGRKNVYPVVASLKFSKRSKIYNKFEIEKAKKICKHLDIKLNIIRVDYSYVEKYLNEINLISKKHMLTNSLAYFLHYNLIKQTIAKFGKGDFYSGEISDGSQNFGFSQYITLTDHTNNGYREYGDKMMNYLVGPSFLKKIFTKKYLGDPIYQLLSKKMNIKTEKIKKGVTKKEIIEKFLTSMFLSESRFPLNQKMSNYLNIRNKNNYINLFKQKYLSNLNIKNFKQIYAAYIYLYNKFHWQGSTVRTAYHIANDKGLDFINIFWNKKTMKFLSELPEEYGRGLELKETKYFEKKILRKSIDVDKLNISPHSYLSDTNELNAHIELIFYSPMNKIINKTFKRYRPQVIFDKKYFNHSYINKLLKKFNNKTANGDEADKIYTLFTVCKFFEEINY